jgi:hypothetical protein
MATWPGTSTCQGSRSIFNFLSNWVALILVPQSHCHSVTRTLKIRLWVRRLNGEIWLASQITAISLSREVEQFSLGKIILSTYVNTNTSFLRNTSLWKLLRVLKRPNWRACALETTARFLALPVPCVPGPREDARGPGNEDGVALWGWQHGENSLLHVPASRWPWIIRKNEFLSHVMLNNLTH